MATISSNTNSIAEQGNRKIKPDGKSGSQITSNRAPLSRIDPNAVVNDDGNSDNASFTKKKASNPKRSSSKNKLKASKSKLRSTSLACNREKSQSGTTSCVPPKQGIINCKQNLSTSSISALLSTADEKHVNETNDHCANPLPEPERIQPLSDDEEAEADPENVFVRIKIEEAYPIVDPNESQEYEKEMIMLEEFYDLQYKQACEYYNYNPEEDITPDTCERDMCAIDEQHRNEPREKIQQSNDICLGQECDEKKQNKDNNSDEECNKEYNPEEDTHLDTRDRDICDMASKEPAK